MDPLSVLASAITTYVLPKALEKIGERVGTASLAKSEETIQAIRQTVQNKLSETRTDGILAMAKENPSAANADLLQNMLLGQLQADPQFATQLEQLLQHAQNQSPSLQSVLTEVRIKGNLTTGNLRQTSHAKSSQQTVGSNLGVGGDATFGDIHQDVR